ncbi:MAG: D-alanyl-D-alanine carboxypeptidase/D-alanyl-D-alanine-endopeptidase [Gemmatimonadota bacterium]
MDDAELRTRLERLLADPALLRAHVGLMVQVAGSGRILFERNAEKRFTAASTTKLVTGAVALHRLGAAYRWHTRLLSSGPILGDTLLGDLWVVGGGDPTIGPATLRRWAGAVKRAGIRRIAGRVIGDDRAFDPLPWGRGWMWDDLYASWSGGVSALELTPSVISAELEPGSRVGDAARFRVADPGAIPPIANRVRTGPPGSERRLRFRPRPGQDSVRLEGWVPSDGGPVPLRLAPRHPTLHLLERLLSVFADSDIIVQGGYLRVEEEEPPAQPAWSVDFTSDSLGVALRRMLKNSDNQIAESLLRTLGREAGAVGSARAGLQAVEETLAGWGIEPGAASLADGSGLSRYSALSPNALNRLLRRMSQLPEFSVFRDALPVAAKDGTLVRRFLSTAAARNVLAKTGSLAGVRALAGYVTDGDGESLVFSLLLNEYDAPGEVAAALEDLLVEQLALYHGPTYPQAREHRWP